MEYIENRNQVRSLKRNVKNSITKENGRVNERLRQQKRRISKRDRSTEGAKATKLERLNGLAVGIVSRILKNDREESDRKCGSRCNVEKMLIADKPIGDGATISQNEG